MIEFILLCTVPAILVGAICLGAAVFCRPKRPDNMLYEDRVCQPTDKEYRPHD